MKIVITQNLYGVPYDDYWMTEYIKNCDSLGKYGWEWKFFMPKSKYKSTKYVELIDQTMEEFNDLMFKKLGVESKNYIDNRGIPHKLTSDYYPAHGILYEDWTKGYDFWGHVNWDMVFGRLDRVFNEEFLKDVDIYGNDPDAINGCFSLYRNNEYVNNLFKEHPKWKEALAYVPEPHTVNNPYVFDEWCMTELCNQKKNEGKLRFKTGWYMVNDHMDRHKPKPQIEMKEDGTLLDKITGEEIMMFHFSGTKAWPL